MTLQRLLLGKEETVHVSVEIEDGLGTYVGTRPADSFAPGRTAARIVGTEERFELAVAFDGVVMLHPKL